ncbi:hypothetical protein DAPPUDRAFT_270546 [Daphnia pulex]|uniref:Uncharacterized protein n=1 Tax=Daphnia pulex TaxID=6669 RepID=E9I0X0_DAPPU|nr:hypothetical protein DAPPUDRAFT_270546 [Daphnia pulex]|eukprot:EFX62361.1 hypothetical protein DAPPUDRAFT_270546 [Daphnia pulex]
MGTSFWASVIGRRRLAPIAPGSSLFTTMVPSLLELVEERLRLLLLLIVDVPGVKLLLEGRRTGTFILGRGRSCQSQTFGSGTLAAASHQSAQAAAAVAAASKAAEHQNNQPSPKIKRDPAEDSRSSSSSRHSTEEEEEEGAIRMSSSITGPVVLSSAASVPCHARLARHPPTVEAHLLQRRLAPLRRPPDLVFISPAAATPTDPGHRSVPPLRRQQQKQQHEHRQPRRVSHAQRRGGQQSMMDSTEEVDCDVDCDEDDEDVDIEEEEGMSETCDSTPKGKIYRPSPTLASVAASMFHHHHHHHHHPQHPANLMSHHHFQHACMPAGYANERHGGRNSPQFRRIRRWSVSVPWFSRWPGLARMALTLRPGRSRLGPALFLFPLD